MQIYLDYSATTPQRWEVTENIQQVAASQWGNASSLHAWGERSALFLEEARFKVARLIHAAAPDTITFTSGGTEADNLALFGITRQYCQPQHLIISRVEHAAIAEPVNFLEQQGWQITRLGVNCQGRVNPEELQASIRSNTVLISIIYGQSEVGTLQPIEKLARIARDRGVLFHTDAVQVAGRLPLDVEQLGVDLLSLSSHKLYGPQGMGALYVRQGVKLLPLLMGGGQEGGVRSGTQAIALISGFGVAAELALQDLEIERSRLRELRDRLFDRLADCPYLIPTGDRLHRLPHHVSFCLTPPLAGEVTGKAIVRQMNLAGIAIGAGSACHSGKLSPSPILQAMGYDDAMALAGIRFSLGKDTTPEDIDWTAMVLKQVLGRFMAKMTVLK
ncbi:MAG: cysteine desulfurase [Cyanobacteria bacterium SBLK]|nr:cysteine desulfurase [Cyanobacteria bacterium SBLK]